MNRTVRNLNHADFKKRVARVDGRFALLGDIAYVKDRTQPRPFGAALVGFGWIYLVAAVARNRDHISRSLEQGSIPVQYHDWILNGLAIMLAASLTALALHAFRYFTHEGGKKKNSGGILIGAITALTLFYTPAGVWQTGFGMLDSHSQAVLLTASNTLEDTFPGLPSVNLEHIATVSSNGSE